MMSMTTGPELVELLRLAYAANLPVLLVGKHGVGKSEGFEACARELGVDVIVRDLSIMEPTDLVGLPAVVNGKTTYAPPSFLPTTGRGLFVFEELNRAPRYMRAPCLQLLTARTLNDYRLPQGWLPCAAINDGEGYDVEELDPALLSRFLRVRIEPEVDAWCRWAAAQCIDERVIEYVRVTPKAFAHADGNPRAFRYAGDVVKAWATGAPNPTALRAALMGVLNASLGTSLAAFVLKQEAPLTFEDVIERYHATRGQVLRWSQAARVDLIAASWTNLRQHLGAQRHYDALLHDRAHGDGQKADYVEAFIADLPADLIEAAREWFEERGYDEIELPKKTGRRRARR